MEAKLRAYTKPSSDHEQERQARAERIVKQGVGKWLDSRSDLYSSDVRYVVKGSYANNTNVRQDSDVDIAVVRTDCFYYDDGELLYADRLKASGSSFPLVGIAYRDSLGVDLKRQFSVNCDDTGKTAIELFENSGRVSADVVPSFSFRKYYYDELMDIRFHEGHKVYRTDGTTVVNYPEQQLTNGRKKNANTGTRYKQLVRIFKRAENDLVEAGLIDPLPSYFMECLMYRVPDSRFGSASDTRLTDDLSSAVAYIWSNTGEGGGAASWLEPNDIKPIFGAEHSWTMAQANSLALNVFSHFNLGSN